jgi:predicted PurR-regulated permease PerM
MRTFEESYRSKVFWTLVVLACVAGFFMLMPFIPALLWAIVLTVLVKPIDERFRKRFNPSVSAGFTTIVTLLLIGIPLFLVGAALFVQVNGFIREFQSQAPTGQSAFSQENLIRTLEANFGHFARSISPSFSFEHWWTENSEQLRRSLTAPLGKFLYSAGYTVFTLVVAFLTMFFMLRDAHRLQEPALELLPLPRDRSLAIFTRMAATIRAVFIGVVLVALIQGTAAGVLYAATGVPNSLMWGVATIVLCTIPLLGAPIIYVPLAIMLAANGKPIQAAILLGVGFGVVSNIDNILRPFIIGARVELHPMAIFFSLLGGVLALGPVGIMAGPMLLTVLLAAQDIIRERRRLSQTGQLSEDQVFAESEA